MTDAEPAASPRRNLFAPAMAGLGMVFLAVAQLIPIASGSGSAVNWVLLCLAVVLAAVQVALLVQRLRAR